MEYGETITKYCFYSGLRFSLGQKKLKIIQGRVGNAHSTMDFVFVLIGFANRCNWDELRFNWRILFTERE